VVSNPWALAAVPFVLVLQVLSVYWPPLTRVLSTVPISASEWLVVLPLSVLPALVGQGIRMVRTNRGTHAPLRAAQA
jgi:magnesium-transporting ATPase (P-type)